MIVFREAAACKGGVIHDQDSAKDHACSCSGRHKADCQDAGVNSDYRLKINDTPLARYLSLNRS